MAALQLKNPRGEAIDFDDAGRKLLAGLNLSGVRDPATSQWNNLDAIYAHPSSGGVIYVGNATAAESMEIWDSTRSPTLLIAQMGAARFRAPQGG